jgi:uncharacterized cupredoxin-like copper-binding protein
VKRTGEDRNGFGFATVAFMFLAVLLAMAALVVAGQAWSRSNDTRSEVSKLASGGLLGHRVKVTLEEFTLTPHPNEAKAGTVRCEVDNVGTMTHEMVVARAPSAAALPKVTAPNPERAIGDVDEAAIPSSDKIGETGDVKPGQHVVKTFKLTPGTYVLFCNIDDANPDGTVTSHFQRGMSDTITVR